MNYAETRIREALKLSGGHRLKAQKYLEKWCAEDSRLLQELTRPHMTGILAHAMERVSNKVARGEPPPPPIPETLPDEAGDIAFGKELLKNLGMGKPPKFAQEGHFAPVKKKKASQSHINAIHLLAGKRKDT